MNIEIKDNFEMPNLRGSGVARKPTKYPFDELKVGQGFEVDVSHLKDCDNFRNVCRANAIRLGFVLQCSIDKKEKKAYVRREK